MFKVVFMAYLWPVSCPICEVSMVCSKHGFMGCFMAQFGTILGTLLWLFMADLWAIFMA